MDGMRSRPGRVRPVSTSTVPSLVRISGNSFNGSLKRRPTSRCSTRLRTQLPRELGQHTRQDPPPWVQQPHQSNAQPRQRLQFGVLDDTFSYMYLATDMDSAGNGYIMRVKVADMSTSTITIWTSSSSAKPQFTTQRLVYHNSAVYLGYVSMAPISLTGGKLLVSVAGRLLHAFASPFTRSTQCLGGRRRSRQ